MRSGFENSPQEIAKPNTAPSSAAAARTAIR
jgi:hypothetical protein